MHRIKIIYALTESADRGNHESDKSSVSPFFAYPFYGEFLLSTVFVQRQSNQTELLHCLAAAISLENKLRFHCKRLPNLHSMTCGTQAPRQLLPSTAITATQDLDARSSKNYRVPYLHKNRLQFINYLINQNSENQYRRHKTHQKSNYRIDFSSHFTVISDFIAEELLRHYPTNINARQQRCYRQHIVCRYRIQEIKYRQSANRNIAQCSLR